MTPQTNYDAKLPAMYTRWTDTAFGWASPEKVTWLTTDCPYKLTCARYSHSTALTSQWISNLIHYRTYFSLLHLLLSGSPTLYTTALTSHYCTYFSVDLQPYATLRMHPNRNVWLLFPLVAPPQGRHPTSRRLPCYLRRHHSVQLSPRVE